MIRKLISTAAVLLLSTSMFAWQAYDSAGEKAGGGYGGPSYLGVDVEDISPQRAKALNLADDSGIEITMVDRDAPAGKAGLQEHDVILKFEGAPVESVEQIRRLLRETPAGRTVTLTISRNGQIMPVKVTLAQRQEAFGYGFAMPPMPLTPEMPKIPRIEMPQFDIVMHQYSKTGLMVENLTPQLREFFGAKPGEGVLVRAVEKGSSAATAGFKAGDVIVSVGNEKISDVGDWRTTLAMKKGAVPVGILRDKHEQTITLTLAGKDSSMMLPELPDVSIATDEVNREIAQLGPKLEKLQKQLQSKEFQDNMRRTQQDLKRSLEEMQKELERQGREIQKTVEN